MALSLIQLTLGVFKNPLGGRSSGRAVKHLVARLENTIAPGRRASDFVSPEACGVQEL